LAARPYTVSVGMATSRPWESNSAARSVFFPVSAMHKYNNYKKYYICFPVSQLITIKDKQFKPYISDRKIAGAVAEVASRINKELMNELPVFLVVLNGSFMFAADLLKEVTIPCEISFIKVASYHGTSSSGSVSELIGLTEDISGRTVVIVEDIVDTGTTLEKLIAVLKRKNVKQIKVACALFKPEAYKKEYKVDYAGIEIGNDFVVGYGLDYEGMGRNLKEIYVLA
jgi:hypoxanthine phosphoribosyltransferase